MSDDPNDAIREAKGQNQRLLARLLQDRKDLATEVEKIDRQRAEAAELAASAGDRDDLRIEAEKILSSLMEQLRAKRDELDVLEGRIAAARGELKNLDGLKGEAARTAAQAATVAAGIGADPLIRSPEQIALDNARSHVADLDAQVKVNDELALETTAPAPSDLKQKMTDDEARRQFEEMRANRPKKS
jgi:hypothetical protein